MNSEQWRWYPKLMFKVEYLVMGGSMLYSLSFPLYHMHDDIW